MQKYTQLDLLNKSIKNISILCKVSSKNSSILFYEMSQNYICRYEQFASYVDMSSPIIFCRILGQKLS